MGFYQEPVIAPARVRRSGIKIRVRNHDSLGDALGSGMASITSLIASRGIQVAPSPSAPVNTSPVSTSAPLLPSAPSSFSPVQPAPTPIDPLTSAPSSSTPVAPGGVFQAPQGVNRFSPTGGSDPVTQTVSQAAQAAQTVSPIIGAVAGPAAGAAAAIAPAFSQAYASSGDSTQVRFDTSDSGSDLSLPEVYNADGTPVTTSAKAATLADKIKALPTAAKLGGVVALYVLFSRR